MWNIVIKVTLILPEIPMRPVSSSQQSLQAAISKWVEDNFPLMATGMPKSKVEVTVHELPEKGGLQ
jgi:hypothetical protein